MCFVGFFVLLLLYGLLCFCLFLFFVGLVGWLFCVFVCVLMLFVWGGGCLLFLFVFNVVFPAVVIYIYKAVLVHY